MGLQDSAILRLRNISQSPSFAAVKRAADESEGMREGYDLLTVGITFALTVTASLLLGRWADRRFGTAPLLLVTGTLLGTGLGGFWAWLRVTRQGKAK